MSKCQKHPLFRIFILVKFTDFSGSLGLNGLEVNSNKADKHADDTQMTSLFGCHMKYILSQIKYTENEFIKILNNYKIVTFKLNIIFSYSGCQ